VIESGLTGDQARGSVAPNALLTSMYWGEGVNDEGGGRGLEEVGGERKRIMSRRKNMTWRGWFMIDTDVPLTTLRITILWHLLESFEAEALRLPSAVLQRSTCGGNGLMR
jgi:hypothetical protein